MPRAYHRLGLRLAVVASCVGCGAEPAPAISEHAPGPDCVALADAARAAQGCDPELSALADGLLEHADETECRRQVRRLLDPAPSDAAIHSVFEASVAQTEPALTEAERQRLADLPMPAMLSVVPDLPRQPGLPSTRLRVDAREVTARADGTFSAHLPPGEHALTLHHAAQESEFCVELRSCARLQLKAHGHHLAPHAAVRAGRCSEATPAVAAGATPAGAG